MISSIPATAWHAAHTTRSAEPPVLCLHSSSGNHRQWQSLESVLGDERRVIAPDLLGYGANPPWRNTARLRLADEVHALRPALALAGAPVDVVAHSFGAAVAVQLAIDEPAAVRSLCLYEPVLFGLLRQQPSATRALTEIFMLAGGVESAIARGDNQAAARRFVEFWSGRGAWKAMPKPRRAAIAGRIDKVVADFEAVLAADTTPAQLRRLQMPVLCLSGARSPQAVQRVSELLAGMLPSARHVRLADAGHMGPLTHARETNACIAAHLDSVSANAESYSSAAPTSIGAQAA